MCIRFIVFFQNFTILNRIKIWFSFGSKVCISGLVVGYKINSKWTDFFFLVNSVLPWPIFNTLSSLFIYLRFSTRSSKVTVMIGRKLKKRLVIRCRTEPTNQKSNFILNFVDWSATQNPNWNRKPKYWFDWFGLFGYHLMSRARG